MLHTALLVIDRDRPESFTMRAVAEEMGMAVMTLYGYFRSKEEILAGVTSLALDQAHVALPAGAAWDARLRSDARDLHRTARRHPNLVALVLAQSTAVPGMFRLRERMLDTLRGAGFDAPTALFALGVLCNYVLGFSGAQAGVAPIELPDRIRELPAAEFPRLTEVADSYAAHLTDEAFEYGLELLLRGLAGDLGPASTA